MSDLVNYLLANEPQFKRSRLPSLYSDFQHLRIINPDGYDANVNAWRIALAGAVRDGLIPSPDGRNDLLSLNSGEELLRALETREYGQPAALGTVINVGVAKGELIPLQTFLTLTDANYSQFWKLVRWGLGYLPLIGGTSGDVSEKLPVGRLVVMDLVRDCAKKILLRVAGQDRVGRIWPLDAFKAEFAGVQSDRLALTDADFDVVLRYLARDLKECAYDSQTVKFRPADEPITPITHEETTIASLKQLITSHEAQISSLTRRIDQLSESAKASISKKNRVAALSALRSKKLAESALTARADTLAQLEEVFDKIRQASDHVQLVRVMEASTGVLKSLHRQTGGVERVEDVVEELREEMTKVDEVGQVIGEIGKINTAAEEFEIEDELEAMEREERERQEEASAAETARKLAQLERSEKKEEKKVEEGQKKRKDATTLQCTDTEVDEQVAGLSRLSLEVDRPAGQGTEQQEAELGQHKLPVA